MTSEPLPEGGDAAGRSMYLIDGRRVTVRALVNAGLLKAGTTLRFTRTRIKATYDATVTEKGLIRLEPDGEEFVSPSRAAMVAAGMRAVDGWRAWLVVDQDRMLDAVRQELLDRYKKDGTRQRIHDRLRQARGRADGGAPERMTVRELLQLWGLADRGEHIGEIEADLANHGLTTNPSFRAVTLDTLVSLVTPQDEAESPEVAAPPDLGGVATVEDEEDDDLSVRLMMGNLSPLDGVTSVGPESTFNEAITKMLLNDFSQLPVLSGSRTLRGVVTWRSIAQAIHQKPDAVLADAIDHRVEAVPYDRDLVEVLPLLQQREFVFVRDAQANIAGIVTTADITAHYGEMATPFFQLGEMDQTLRGVLKDAVEPRTVQRVCKRKIADFDGLSFGEYQRLLEDKEVWERLNWRLDRRAFIDRLNEIRVIRNKVMHFHPDPIPADAIDKIRSFNGLLHRYRTSAQAS